MSPKALLVVALGVTLLVVGAKSFYVVSEMDQVIITQFGKPIGEPIDDAGPHFCIPFVQKVNRFDKRWLEWDGEPDEMPTREKTLIYVDTYARWRIADPLKYFTSTTGIEAIAQSRLDGIIDPETRNVVARHDLIEVVRSSDRAFEVTAEAKLFDSILAQPEKPQITAGRDALTQMILKDVAEKALQQLGIEVKDLQFQRVNYTGSVKAKVFDRMVSERKRIAEGYRSEGEGKRAEILGRKELDLKKIESDAYREVQEIRGEADATATAIFAGAYNLEPDLYRMLESLKSYEASFDENSWVILSTDSDYLAPLVKLPAR